MGFIGLYWSIPFFNSKVIKLTKTRYEWQSPNLEVYTFNKVKKSEKVHEEKYSLNTNGKWILHPLRNGDINVVDAKDPSRFYLYKKDD